MKKNKTICALLTAAAATVIFNTAAYFFLPDKIATQITFNGTAPNRTNTLLYLIASASVILLSAGTGIFFDGKNKNKTTKYLIVTFILFTANAAVIIFNLL